MNRFEDLMRSTGGVFSAEERDHQWEDLSIRMILRESGYGRLSRQVLAASGRPKFMSWEGFRAVLYNFPYHLYSSRLLSIPVPESTETTKFDYVVDMCPKYYEPVRFRHFTRTPVYGLFNALRAQYDGDKPLGLVYPMQGFKNGMIIHNDDSERFWTDGSAWVFKGTQANPDKVYLEPFSFKVKQMVSEAKSDAWF